MRNAPVNYNALKNLKKHSYIFVAIALSTFQLSKAYSETVTTTDGRKIILNDDGSYEILSLPENDWSNFVEILSPKFKVSYETQDRRSIRFMPRFKNVQPSKILGIKFKSEFSNSFGENILDFVGIHEDSLDYQASTKTQLSFSFAENPDVIDEPFEKLLPLAELKTGKINTRILAISFADGTILNFE
jgi:hypothetical protein